MKKLLLLVWIFLFACGNNAENNAAGDSVNRSGAAGNTGTLIGDSIQLPDTGDRRINYDNLPASPEPSDTNK